jgi:hypothetical protein
MVLQVYGSFFLVIPLLDILLPNNASELVSGEWPENVALGSLLDSALKEVVLADD